MKSFGYAVAVAGWSTSVATVECDTIGYIGDRNRERDEASSETDGDRPPFSNPSVIYSFLVTCTISVRPPAAAVGGPDRLAPYVHF
jgi:hypothetical protein